MTPTAVPASKTRGSEQMCHTIGVSIKIEDGRAIFGMCIGFSKYPCYGSLSLSLSPSIYIYIHLHMEGERQKILTWGPCPLASMLHPVQCKETPPNKWVLSLTFVNMQLIGLLINTEGPNGFRIFYLI